MRDVGLGDGVTPLGYLQVDVRPFGFAQLPESNEDQGSQPQGTTHDQRSFIAIYDLQQGADLPRLGEGSKVLSLDGWQRASEVPRRVPLSPSGGHGIAKHLSTVLKHTMGGFQSSALFDPPQDR